MKNLACLAFETLCQDQVPKLSILAKIAAAEKLKIGCDIHEMLPKGPFFNRIGHKSPNLDVTPARKRKIMAESPDTVQILCGSMSSCSIRNGPALSQPDLTANANSVGQMSNTEMIRSIVDPLKKLKLISS